MSLDSAAGIELVERIRALVPRLLAASREDAGFVLRCFRSWSADNNLVSPPPASPRTPARVSRPRDLLATDEQLRAFVLSAILAAISEASSPRAREDQQAGRAGPAGEPELHAWVREQVSPAELSDLVRLFDQLRASRPGQDVLGQVHERWLSLDRPRQGRSGRQRLGQYYTPKPIVRLIWALVRETLREARGRDLYVRGQPCLDVLDPACGSGTFLCEAVLQATACASQRGIDGDGRVAGVIGDRAPGRALEDHLFGLEIDPLSRSIAEINLLSSLAQAHVPGALWPLSGGQPGAGVRRLQLHRADALALEGPAREATPGQYDVVIGNPPYGQLTASKKISERLIPFAVPAYNFDEAGQEIDFDHRSRQPGSVPAAEKNRGKLREMYAVFIGAADRWLRPGGVLGLVTPNSWLSIPTYRYLRKYLLKRYTIHYIINFNNVGDRLSMFAPEAGIATCILVATREPPADQQVKYLDLSSLETVPAKYDAFCDVHWRQDPGNKDDIRSFVLRPIQTLPFMKVPQAQLLRKPDYLMRVSGHEAITLRMLRRARRLSSYGADHQGVDVGDLQHLVAPTLGALKRSIQKWVFAGELEGFGETSRGWIERNLRQGRIERRWRPELALPFVYQKHMQRFGYRQEHWTYMDRQILWRSRLRRGAGEQAPILSRKKLFVLERREQGRLVSLVTDHAVAPQHGGRFFYIVTGEQLDEDGLYLLCALLNSAAVTFYYRVEAQGNKDLRVQDVNAVPKKIARALVRHCRELHAVCGERGQRVSEAGPAAAAAMGAIDELVFEMYGLSAAERRTIQQRVSAPACPGRGGPWSRP